MITIRAFFPSKLGQFFPNFEQMQEGPASPPPPPPPPLPPLSSPPPSLPPSSYAPKRAVRKQFTVFFLNIFKITKVEGNIFCGWGRRKEQKKVFSRSSDPDVFCKNSILKYLVQLKGKHLGRSLSLACSRETFLKKRLLHRCFPIKFIRAAFWWNTRNSLTTLTIIFNFVENISKFSLVHEAIWKRI